MLTTEQWCQELCNKTTINGLRETADFCGVTDATALGWFSGENVPTGEKLLKLRVFLDQAGLEVEEFTPLPNKVKELARAMAFGILDHKEVTEALGYSTSGGSGVYGIVLHGKGVTQERARIVDELVASCREMLDHHAPMADQAKGALLVGLGGESAESIDLPRLPAHAMSMASVLLGNQLASAAMLIETLRDDINPETAQEWVLSQVGSGRVAVLQEWLFDL